MKEMIMVAALCAVALGACKGNNDRSLEAEAHDLFDKSVRLTELYTDSLAAAKDSATVQRLDRDFDDRLTKLNFEYPADTYLEMSQGQNDTLTNLTLRYVELRDSMLHRIAYPDTTSRVLRDTI